MKPKIIPCGMFMLDFLAITVQETQLLFTSYKGNTMQ